MNEDVTFVAQALHRLLHNINIDVDDLHIEHVANNNYILQWKTKAGDYSVPIVYDAPIRLTFRLKNIPLKRSILLNDFAVSVLYTIIYNMGAAGDTRPVEFFFQALCTYWDLIFIDVIHSYESKLNDAMKLLKTLIYKNPEAEIDPHKWIHSPAFLIFFITGPSGNQLYYTGGLHQRSDIQRVRKGVMY
jgi:hypothetical protein